MPEIEIRQPRQTELEADIGEIETGNRKETKTVTETEPIMSRDVMVALLNDSSIIPNENVYESAQLMAKDKWNFETYEQWQQQLFGVKETDCGDRICSLEHRILPTCILYLPNPNTDCNIPCKMENCKKEIHYFFDCPLWECVPKTTTISPPVPTPTPAEPSHNAVLYVSIALNALFVVCFVLFFYKAFQSFRQMRLRQRETGNTRNADLERGIIRDTFVNQHFSLADEDDNESDALLSGSSSGPVQQEGAGASLLDRLRAFEWSRAQTKWLNRDRSEPQSENREPANDSNDTSNQASNQDNFDRIDLA